MEEIIDLEELEKEVTPENLKEFMKKDEETENLLSGKIEELSKEEEKLNSKEEEIKSLEESNREKINTSASPDELIEIAGKIKEAEEELVSIKENIDKLSKEKEEIVKTKEQFENSKKEYIKKLSETSSNYEVQLNKISEAMNVCDNPTLKQVLEDVEAKMNEELNELKEKRLNELKIVLNEEDEEEEVKETPVLDVPTTNEVVPETKDDSIISIESLLSDQSLNVEAPVLDVKQEEINNASDVVPNIENNILDINLNSVQEQPQEVPSINNDILNVNIEKEQEVQPANTNNVLNTDFVLDTPIAPDLNKVSTDNIIIPQVNTDVTTKNTTSDKIKIIYEKDVPNVLVKEIYSSSKIMPSLYDYLNNKNEGSFI